jgi:glutamate N-acetyltransferase / amino-acid N-acetyltransferase
MPRSWSSADAGAPGDGMLALERIDGGLGVFRGLAFGAVHAGVRDSVHRSATAPDLALLDVGRSVPAAIVTTTNQVLAAPCVIAREHVASGPIRAVIINSGNANACTGAQGLVDARTMAMTAAAALGCSASEVVPMSTGVIGVPLPIHRIAAAVPGLLRVLAPGVDAAADLARAIMTTDTVPKQVAVASTDGTFRVAGVAKGAGMIEPAMATMLSVIVTDAALDAATCAEVLGAAVGRTFNRISVDSCGSTNDTVVLLATGDAGPVDRDAVATAVEHVAAELARMVVRDGEGVTRIARLRVHGAPDETSASAWGRAIAGSALFRTALHGSDPNWGRILAAMGTTSVPFDPSRVEVRFGDVTVCRDGGAVDYDHAAAVATLRADEVPIDVGLSSGGAEAVFLIADLSAGYVRINAEYTT